MYTNINKYTYMYKLHIYVDLHEYSCPNQLQTTLMSMPRADEALLMNLEGTREAGSGSSRPNPRLRRISSGSSSYRSNSSDTLRTHKRSVSRMKSARRAGEHSRVMS